VAIWTRELIEAAIACGGRYYLPYQAHATAAQFHAAYPGANELFALKRRLDPDYRFRNVLWDTYYQPAATPEPSASGSEFHFVYDDVDRRDRFYLFLQNVFRLQPEDRLHNLICETTSRFESDEEIYRYIQDQFATVKPALADLSYALPALKKQKRVIAGQTATLLDPAGRYEGYLEIGSTGRYYSVLRKQLSLQGPAYFISDIAPGYGPPDLIDRGRIRQFGAFFDLDDYAPISAETIADNSLDIVTCYIGLHHIHPDRQHAFAQSIARVLRPGGAFILRDHDAGDDGMRQFASLVHTVFNAGTGESWETNAAEPRYFEGLEHWVSLLAAVGLVDQGQRLYQDHDPSENVLMSFVKAGSA
jgi:SAM-dependent methyltransferase